MAIRDSDSDSDSEGKGRLKYIDRVVDIHNIDRYDICNTNTVSMEK